MEAATQEASKAEGVALPPRRMMPAWLSATLQRILLIGVVLAVWEVATDHYVDPFWVSQPSLIAARLWQMAASGDLVWHASATAWQALLGLLLGLVVGVLAGVLYAAFPRGAQLADPLVMGLYSVPRVAFAPLFIIWFGIGLLSKVMMAFSMVVFVYLLNTAQGLREVDRDLLDAMRSMRARPLWLLWHVRLPAILPWIFGATRIGLGLALVGSVLGELLGANRGLGWYVERSGGRLDTTGVMAGLIALMVIAVVGNEIVRLIERFTLRGAVR
ncbi:ABC transporter permease [Roseomonas chloroacetimidivorans]|jgi:NitT/TauT family transport system permease protein|uniref:ABC transporter permease n=1 Tax=Roseomonas chloroacetimidivorans TaxID=1766656 RepID=UPI003C708007